MSQIGSAVIAICYEIPEEGQGKVKNKFADSGLSISDLEVSAGCNTTYLAFSVSPPAASAKEFWPKIARAYEAAGLPSVPGRELEQIPLSRFYEFPETAHEEFSRCVRRHRFSG